MITDRQPDNSVHEMDFRYVLENIKLHAVTLDMQGTILFCNNFLLDSTGFHAHEVLGKSWFDTFVPPELRDRHREKYHAKMSKAAMPSHSEYEIVTRRGERRLISWDNVYTFGRNNKITRGTSIGQDITEHKRLEDQLYQVEKMATIGRLAGGVAHDFNNLLTVITSYSDLIMKRLDDSSGLRKHILQIIKASKMASSLTNQLLAYSRKQVLKPVLLDLNHVLSDLEPILKLILGKHIELSCVRDADAGQVMADLGQLEQIIMNLVINARDAMPDGGKLTIKTACVDLVEAYPRQREGDNTGRYVLLEVCDTGCGMDQKTISRIFEPFYTTKKVGKGTGLGLATVSGVVRQYGGHIRVYSEPGHGSSFRVFLPVFVKHSGV